MIRILLVVFLFLVSTVVYAMNDNIFNDDIRQQFHKKYLIDSATLSASDPMSIFGESVDLSSGLVMFRRNDGVVKGNSELAVSYPTYYDTLMPDFAGWKEDIPRIEYTYISSGNRSTLSDGWKNGKYCSGSQKINPNSSGIIVPFLHTGPILVVPGTGKFPVLKNNLKLQNGSPSSFPYVTNSLWKISCYVSDETKEEGFKATSPDGVSYFFETKIIQPKIDLYEKSGIKNGSNAVFYTDSGVSVDKKSVYLYVRKIVDRFGNYVFYEYIDGGLSKLESNDGRILTVKYANGEKIVSIKDRSSTFSKDWHYFTRDGKYIVRLPDNREWSYELLIKRYVDTSYPGASCFVGGAESKLMTVSHPNNIIAEFKFSERIDQSSAYVSSRNGVSPPSCRRILNLVEKKVFTEASNFKPLIWKYIYSENEGGYVVKGTTPPEHMKLKGDLPENVDSFLSDSAKVINPDGSYVNQYFSREAESGFEGKLLAKEFFDKNGLYLSSELYNYNEGINFGQLFSYTDGWKNAILTKKIIIDGARFSTSYSNFNEYNKPQEIVDESSVYKNRKTDYIHDEKNWMLNLRQKEYLSNDSTFTTPYKEYVFDSNMLVKSESLFGRLIKTHSYHTDGNLLQTTYNDSGRYEKLENYYRGKARKITLPCALSNGCNTANGSTANTVVALLEVNPDGTTKSVTDFNGNKTAYSYNPIGWLTKIDYTDPKWADKVISYTVVNTSDDGISGSGIAVGSLRQTISQGNYEKRIYHDGLLRPIFTRERDTANASTIRYQTMAYDHENRLTLSSFPSADASNRIGMETEYDALGRIVTLTRTSDGSTSRREYFAGNKVAVTDGENNTTTTTYLAYGEPSFDKPTLIEAPDSDEIAIEYNLFDQVTSIRQGNVTETHLYDAYQQLCKQVRPETGITAFGYNGQRQQIWRAQGTNGSTTSCDAGAVPASHKTLLAYDNLGQLRTENFPDSTPDRTYSYDANGNLLSLLAGPVNWSYLYNSQSGLEKETLSLDGRNFVLDWEYNNLGALSSLKYPSGAVVDFAPNALGQPTKAGSYATGVSYQPNGQIKQFTYGNDIVRNVALDTTGRIDAITDIKGSSVKNSLDPSYDYNDNLARLIDWVDRNNDVDNLVYDGVDRLKSADGKWGTGRYNYDGLGNVLSRSLNNSTINYNYNTTLNRLNNLTGAYAYGYQYDARGNVTHNGRYSLTYNLGQQMTAAKGISYVYDAHNRRVKQTKTDGSNYTVYSQGGQLLHRQAADGTKTDSVYLGKQLVAEVESPDADKKGYIEFEKTNPPAVCRQVPIPGTTKTKLSCSQHKKGFSWKTQNTLSCSGNIERSMGATVSGVTQITGTSGSLNFDPRFTLKVLIACVTNSNETITGSYTF